MAYRLDAQYEQRRNQVLAMKASDVQPGAAHAVIVDIAYREAIVTVAALGDGRTAVWFSDGGGSAGADEQTALLGSELGLKAGQLAHAMAPTRDTPLPREGEVTFYVLIGAQTRAGAGAINELGADQSIFSPLFHAAFRVINDLKARNLVAEARAKNKP